MTFQRPDLLLLGPAAALLVSLALTLQWRRMSNLGRAYGEVARLRLVPRRLQRFPTVRMLCLLAACFALGTAAAGPRPPSPEPPQPPQPLDLAVAVDVSRSMAAEDVGASRIERARVVVSRLAEDVPSARIVLVLFADWPYTLVPPTDDPDVVRYFAHSLTADLVLDRDQGTSFTTAVAHARATLDARPRPEARRAVLVLSDGGSHEPLTEVMEAAESGNDATPIWTAGLGTSAGSTIPSATGPLLDESGRVVSSSLEDDVLRDLARAGRGEYHDVSTDGGLEALVDGLGALGDESPSGDTSPGDAAFWLTLLSIPLLLAEGAMDTGRRTSRRRQTGGLG